MSYLETNCVLQTNFFVCVLSVVWMVLGYSRSPCILQFVFKDSRKLML